MGWVRSYLDAVRRLRAKLQGGAFTLVGGEDGKRQKVTEADFLENFLRKLERLRVRYRGEEVLPPYPLGEALKETVNPLPQLLQNAADAQRRLDAQLEDESK